MCGCVLAWPPRRGGRRCLMEVVADGYDMKPVLPTAHPQPDLPLGLATGAVPVTSGVGAMCEGERWRGHRICWG